MLQQDDWNRIIRHRHPYLDCQTQQPALKAQIKRGGEKQKKTTKKKVPKIKFQEKKMAPRRVPKKSETLRLSSDALFLPPPRASGSRFWVAASPSRPFLRSVVWGTRRRGPLGWGWSGWPWCCSTFLTSDYSGPQIKDSRRRWDMIYPPL